MDKHNTNMDELQIIYVHIETHIIGKQTLEKH